MTSSNSDKRTGQQQLRPEELARTYIDKHLKNTGWKPLKEGDNVPKNGSYYLPELEIGGLYADYALYIDGVLWAIVEAKKEGVESLEEAMVQAVERYARRTDPKVKYVYAANTKLDNHGNTIINLIFRDLREEDSRSRQLFSFHTPRGLQLLDTRDDQTANQQLVENPSIPVKGGLRYYQAEAVNAIDKGLNEKKRRMLLHMATGCGKTWTVVEMIYRFLSTNPKRFKRILFLVDRRELANQAVTAFATYDAMPGRKFDEIYEVYCDRIPSDEEQKVKYNSKVMTPTKVTAPKEGDAHVYVTTIQRLFGQITGRKSFRSDEEEDELEWEDKPIEYNQKIPIDAFDLIISDECHRSIYNQWEIVLNYFDAVQVGLTATPTGRTFVFFDRNLEYRYPLKKAVDDGYLVDYDPIRIKTKSTEEGATIPAQQRIEIKDKKTGQSEEEFFEEEIKIDTRALEKDLTVPDRLRKVVQEFKKYWKPGEKTLVFAKNDEPKTSHADALVKALRTELGLGNDKVIKITYKCGSDTRRLIKKFRNNPDEAWIAVTVDMLSTGFDAPRIQHLLIDRAVQSRVLFEQMMGRGTRKCKEIGKTHFTVFDTMGILEIHRTLGNCAFDEEYQEPSKRFTIRQVVDKINRGINQEVNIDRLVKKVHRIAKKLPPAGIEDFAIYDEIPGGDLGEFAAKLKENLSKNFQETFQLFRDDVFLEKLEKWSGYDQSKFLIAHDYIDEVESENYFRSSDGKKLKPDDYIESFVEWVKENDDKVDALEIMMKKPSNLELKHVKELAKALRKLPEQYTVRKLNKALELSEKEELKTHSNKVLDLVSELVSYVKYAEDDDHFSSLQEKIDMAIAHIITQDNFNIQQKKWFDIIRDFVITNLRITKEDLQKRIVFQRAGGYTAINKVFDGKLDNMIKAFNEAVQ